MANNKFKSINAVLTTDNDIVYTTPNGFTTIVINAHVSNTADTPATVTFSHFAGESGDERSLVSDFRIRGNDAYAVTLGNLVINSGDSLKAYSNLSSPLRLTMSLLETGA
jgi:hypothetical protein